MSLKPKEDYSMVKLELEALLKFQHLSLGLGVLLGLLELSGTALGHSSLLMHL